MRESIEITDQQIRDKASELAANGTRYGLTQKERHDLALLVIIIRKYDSLGEKK